MTISSDKSFGYTIPSGTTNGPLCSSVLLYQDMVSMLIAAPLVLPETLTIDINSQADGTGVWSRLQDDAAVDLTGPTAGKARFYPQLVGAPAFRLVASGAVAADRVFRISGQFTT